MPSAKTLLGIVVRDLEATVGRYVDDYGIGPREVYEFDAGEGEDFASTVSRSSAPGALPLPRSATPWEQIEPPDEESVYPRFLAEKSEGVHHVAVATPTPIFSGTPGTTTKEEPVTDEPQFDIEITRVLDAPPERVYRAFIDPDQFAQWYGPVGFPVHRDTVELDAWVGGRHRFAMVSEDDPSLRTGFDGRFAEVVRNELLSSRGSWDGIPGQTEAWPSSLHVEFHDQDGKTRLVVRSARTRPAPPISAARRGDDLPKLESCWPADAQS